MAMSVIGLIITIAVYIILMYRGLSPILVAPICSVLLALFSGVNAYTVLTGAFAAGFGGTVTAIGLMFIGSTFFGSVMAKAGASEAIALWIADHMNVKKCTWALVIASTIMSYGGMSFGGYIVIYPIALILCEKANYNKGIIMGAVLCGAWTYSMTGPWSPTVGNIVASQVLKVGTDAGLAASLPACIVMLLGGCIYLEWQAKKWEKKGRIFDSAEELKTYEVPDRTKLPNVFQSVLPIIVAIILFNVFKISLGVALFLAGMVAIALMWNRFKPGQWMVLASEGCKDGIMPTCNLAIVGGFSAVMKVTPIFTFITNFLSTSTLNPYFVSAIAGTIFAFCLGSCSNAVNMLMNTIPQVFLDYGAKGFDMGNIMRLLNQGAGGASIMPHAGSMATMNAIMHTNFKESYFPVFITCVIIPLACTYLINLPLVLLGL
ncbi:hypothetical protein SDC9_54338 [bioreactor metagenome]|uniref:Citrate transporter-like domain-containing protein n=1 Tax=bioreactor metagenome TaxID=1076179 RepID=A0A644WVS5_9ZZZZ